MTVASVYIYDVKPGRMEDFHNNLRRATAIIERLGTSIHRSGPSTASSVAVEPERMDDLLDLLRTANEYSPGHGCRQVTHRQVSVAGPATGLVVSAYQYNSLSDWAASREAMATSEAGDAALGRQRQPFQIAESRHATAWFQRQ